MIIMYIITLCTYIHIYTYIYIYILIMVETNCTFTLSKIFGLLLSSILYSLYINFIFYMCGGAPSGAGTVE